MGTFGKVIQHIAYASTSNIYNVIFIYIYIVFKLCQGLVTFTLPLHTYGFIYVTDRIFCILYIVTIMFGSVGFMQSAGSTAEHSLA